ncbi:MAG: DUF5134 domain-containing protein [Corynebacterium sp.]|uniref:DUF5134 domain-containing protein n=1 Tax=Corynebacterium sp. TaxID=1720 RepID=UPI003F0385A2
MSNLLHLVMSVVMLLMVARPTWRVLTGVILVPGLVGFFAVATVWFVWLAVGAGRSPGRGARLHFLGHAVMFTAMTWHLWAMVVKPSVGHGAHGGHESAGSGMDGWVSAQSQAGGILWWFAVIGLPLMAYLLVAGVRGVWLALFPAARVQPPDCHGARTTGPATYRMAALTEFAMNVGMFWMSVGLMTPVLPFLGSLAF